MLPFIVVAVLLLPESWLDVQAPVELLLAASLIALVHVASYAPRSGLRVLGEARLEALTKVVERGLTVVLYGLLAWQGSTSATAFTCAFLLGALAGWLLALYWVVKTAPATPSDVGWDALGSSWTSTAQLCSLPFLLPSLGFFLTWFELRNSWLQRRVALSWGPSSTLLSWLGSLDWSCPLPFEPPSFRSRWCTV